MNYIHTKPLGFGGGVVVLWDTVRVFVTSITVEPMHVFFVVKLRNPQPTPYTNMVFLLSFT